MDPPPTPAVSQARLKITVRGAVQGVGFRPFVFRLATELDLKGWVNNSPQGVFIELEGPVPQLEKFLLQVESDKPPLSSIQSLEASWLDPIGFAAFEIRPSAVEGARTTLVMPDIATCPDCLREIFDPADRRHGYPFTNCTNCGPRFSIIEALPYDRANTSMKKFTMCSQCQAEYEDPRNRRFHAQPNACPVCGPRLEFRDAHGKTSIGNPATALPEAAEAIRQGKIVALMGLGGFHLIVAAQNEEAVRRLRLRKHREEKPLAVMFPSLESIRGICSVSGLEERLLRSPEAPIVLLRRKAGEPPAPEIAPSVAPGNPYLGAMLPYTPLHHLLLRLLNFPIVATSGNLSDEPICIDEGEAVERLDGIADAFLVHNRPIVRHVDDSVARVAAGREILLRRARGYAPLPVALGRADSHAAVLAVGAHLKNAVALSAGSQVFISQHIGDLETDQAYEAFRRVVGDLEKLFGISPCLVAADAHPDYLSTKFAHEQRAARGNGPALFTVQHHLAHVYACMAENELAPPLLGVAWDGTGFGLDGTVWGGEFFAVQQQRVTRCARLRPFSLPGGDQAIKEPRRTALGLLHAAYGPAAFELSQQVMPAAFSRTELDVLKRMLQSKINCPTTSSAGRLFDAAGALAGLRQVTRFEGQAAMELEFALEDCQSDESYPMSIVAGEPAMEPITVDWGPLLEALLADVRARAPSHLISVRFHNGLVEAIVAVARRSGLERVALSGGCFQNRYLSERAILRLRKEGFRPYWHQRVPPNDGGIALGQATAALSLAGQQCGLAHYSGTGDNPP